MCNFSVSCKMDYATLVIIGPDRHDTNRLDWCWIVDRLRRSEISHKQAKCVQTPWSWRPVVNWWKKQESPATDKSVWPPVAVNVMLWSHCVCVSGSPVGPDPANLAFRSLTEGFFSVWIGKTRSLLLCDHRLRFSCEWNFCQWNELSRRSILCRFLLTQKRMYKIQISNIK